MFLIWFLIEYSIITRLTCFSRKQEQRQVLLIFKWTLPKNFTSSFRGQSSNAWITLLQSMGKVLLNILWLHYRWQREALLIERKNRNMIWNWHLWIPSDCSWWRRWGEIDSFRKQKRKRKSKANQLIPNAKLTSSRTVKYPKGISLQPENRQHFIGSKKISSSKFLKLKISSHFSSLKLLISPVAIPSFPLT